MIQLQGILAQGYEKDKKGERKEANLWYKKLSKINHPQAIEPKNKIKINNNIV